MKQQFINSGGIRSAQIGLDANKPVAGTAGRLYFATDTQIVYFDTGSVWQKIGVVNWGDIANKPSSFTPSAHKTTHATGGTDALTPADIGAASVSIVDPTTGHKHTGASGDGPQLTHDAINTAAISFFRARLTTAQSIAASTVTKVAFNTEDYDHLDEYHVTLYRFTPQKAGIYLVNAIIITDLIATAGARTQVLVYKNGASYQVLGDYTQESTTSQRHNVGSSALMKFVAGDYIEIMVACTVATSITSGIFAAVRIA